MESIYLTIEKIASELIHTDTMIATDGTVREGVTRWVSRTTTGLWFEWDWVEIKPNVIAHNNAPLVRTNINLIYPGGRRVGDCELHKALSVLVYLLAMRPISWQQTVIDSIAHATTTSKHDQKKSPRDP